MSIGANIRRIREEMGLSQIELAEKVHVTQSMLCQIERGTRAPSLPLSTELAAVLGCTLNDLVDRP